MMRKEQTKQVPTEPKPSLSMTSSKAKASPAMRFTGFGAPAAFGSHVFKVSVPPGRAGVVVLTEEYGFLGGHDGIPEHEVRVELPRPKWTPIADASRKDFNTRLRARKVPTGSWKPSDNLLDRMLGKELCVLMWAAEHATEAQVETICSKWVALRPEERWWLYTMTAAEGGTSGDKQRGWRKALYHALSDGEVNEANTARQLRLHDQETFSLFA